MKVLLFDLGGVLIEVISAKRLSELIGNRLTLSEVARRWAQSEFLSLYESGKCDTNTFAQGVIKELDMDISCDMFLSEFKLFLKGFYPGAIELLQSISPEYELACLTDTNEAQWLDLCKRTSADTYFHHRFLSFEIGSVKPDVRVYQHVIHTLACNPGDIAYFDDNEANVRAGLNAGINSHKTAGVLELKTKLSELKLL